MQFGLVINKMPWILEFLDKTWQDWSLSIAGGEFVLFYFYLFDNRINCKIRKTK